MKDYIVFVLLGKDGHCDIENVRISAESIEEAKEEALSAFEMRDTEHDYFRVDSVFVRCE